MKVRVGGMIVAAVVVAVALTGGAAAGSKGSGTVTIYEQAWAGSTANTYVVKNVHEKNLGCKGNFTKVSKLPVYEWMTHVTTDTFHENWGHVPQWNQYVTK